MSADKCSQCGAEGVELRWVFGGGDDDDPANYDMRCKTCSPALKWHEAEAVEEMELEL